MLPTSVLRRRKQRDFPAANPMRRVGSLGFSIDPCLPIHLRASLGAERFEIEAGFLRTSNWMDGGEKDTSMWLELFRSFRGAKSVEVSGGLVTSVASGLE